MSSNPGLTGISDSESFSSTYSDHHHAVSRRESRGSIHNSVTLIDQIVVRHTKALSRWSKSARKRVFDLVCVIGSLPFALPLFLVIGLAVRLTSRGPVLFRQKRSGRYGRLFTIYKFRTMPVRKDAADRPAVTTENNQRFTPVGPFLRRWKLDELPQLWNILRGEMSLVGPRPKLPSHQTIRLRCRPGITGRATFVFAREEAILAEVPGHNLDHYYHEVILPLKHQLDEEYMAEATFSSDINLILQSLLRKWDETELRNLLQEVPHAALPVRKSMERADNRHIGPVMVTTQAVQVSGDWQGD